MYRKSILLFAIALGTFGALAQKNKFQETLSSKKLGMTVKTVKNGDKEEFYQQYYRDVMVENLLKDPSLKGMKPVVAYQFVQEITPLVPTKSLTPEEKALRMEAERSLDQYLENKEWGNPIKIENLETYVDPGNLGHDRTLAAKDIRVLIPNKLFGATVRNSKTNLPEYLFYSYDGKRYEKVDLVPSEKGNGDFYEELTEILPGYKLNATMPVEVKMGDKKLKSDRTYFYIKPAAVDGNEIIYKTEDFKNYTFVRFKKGNGEWTDVEHRPRKW